VDFIHNTPTLQADYTEYIVVDLIGTGTLISMRI
jgi:hypothetical protein